MTRLGIGIRLALCALVFAAMVGPHWLSLRYGRGRLAARLPILFHKTVLRLFSVRVTQGGQPPGPNEPALVLSNHVSWLDILVLGSLRPLSFVAKSEIAGWPVIGMLAKLQRTVFIDRARRAATAQVNETVAARLAAGDLIVLFAEGTTGDGNRIMPFRSSLVGAARAALQAEGAGLERVHLQPLALTYPRRNGLPVIRSERPEIAWYGDMELAPHLGLFAGRGPIDAHVVWGAPIPFEAGTDRKRATAMAEASVRRAVGLSVTGRADEAIPDGRAAPVSARPDRADASLPTSGIAAT